MKVPRLRAGAVTARRVRAEVPRLRGVPRLRSGTHGGVGVYFNAQMVRTPQCTNGSYSSMHIWFVPLNAHMVRTPQCTYGSYSSMHIWFVFLNAHMVRIPRCTDGSYTIHPFPPLDAKTGVKVPRLRAGAVTAWRVRAEVPRLRGVPRLRSGTHGGVGVYYGHAYCTVYTSCRGRPTSTGNDIWTGIRTV